LCRNQGTNFSLFSQEKEVLEDDLSPSVANVADTSGSAESDSNQDNVPSFVSEIKSLHIVQK
jgi:hypothetical protein